VDAKLKEPTSLQTATPPFEDVVKSAQEAAVLVPAELNSSGRQKHSRNLAVVRFMMRWVTPICLKRSPDKVENGCDKGNLPATIMFMKIETNGFPVGIFPFRPVWLRHQSP
jgi:hypothetical protein